MTEAEARAFFDQLASDQGVPVQTGDVADLVRRNPEDVAGVQAAFRDQYARRAAPTSHRAFDSQSDAYDTYADPRREPGFSVASAAGTYGGRRPVPSRSLSGLLLPESRTPTPLWSTNPVGRDRRLSSLLLSDQWKGI